MSKHPLGPWTETQNDVSAIIQGAYVSVYDGKTNTRPMRTGSLYLVRSGVNNGKNSGNYVPSSASLVKRETYWDAPVGMGAIELDQFNNRHTHTGGGYTLYSPISFNALDSSALSFCRNSAYGKLYQKVSGTVAQGGVITGELKETKAMLRRATDTITSRTQSVAKSLGRVYRNARRGAFAPAANEFADLFLEYRFGLMPFLNDAGNVMDACYQASNSKSLLRRVHGTFAKNVTGGYYSKDYVALNYNGTIKGSCDTKVTQLYLCKVGGTLDLRQPLTNPNPDFARFGLQWNQIGPTVYELIPYTWLIDYFMNAQDFIQAFAFPRGVVSNGWKVEIIKTVATQKITPYVAVPSSKITLTSSQTGVVKSFGISFTRVPFVVDSYVPEMVIKNPGMSQVANIAALAVQHLAGTRSRALRAQTTELSGQQMGTLVNLTNERIAFK